MFAHSGHVFCHFGHSLVSACCPADATKLTAIKRVITAKRYLAKDTRRQGSLVYSNFRLDREIGGLTNLQFAEALLHQSGQGFPAWIQHDRLLVGAVGSL